MGLFGGYRGRAGNKYQYNGKEWNDDFGLGWNDYGARFYDPAIFRWLSPDPLSEKYRYWNPYTYVLDNPVGLVDNEGKEPEPPRILAVFFHGGLGGGGTTVTDYGNAGQTGVIFNDVFKEADSRSGQMYGRIIAPGATASSGVKNGIDFLKENMKEGDKVLIYGYSWGGDVAVELAKAAKEIGINVDLLITVDASDGPFQQTTVDNDIPDNVKENQNYFQTSDSGNSSSSRVANASSSSKVKSDGGTSNSPGSNGGMNSAQSPKKTTVVNNNMTTKGTNHGNIQQKVRDQIKQDIKRLLD